MTQTERIDVRGTRIAVRRIPHADRAAPTIVFLHEALGSIAQWKSFPAEACARAGCRGLVYDRQGHGQSAPITQPRTMSFYHDEADALLALLEAEGIERPVLFGHSDGATIALAFGGRHPSVPRGIISEAAHVIIEQITLDGINSAARAYAETDLRGKLSRYHGDKTDAVFHAWADTWRSEGVLDWEMRSDLRGVRCPVLAIQGAGDSYGSPAQLDAIARECPGGVAVMLIADCGHVPHLEARETVLEATVRFIAALP
ncbi:MAG: alpha/beta hydrolase [Ignavibacteria bacterium]|nr:alpha/beta hydrolase [Ignavibacteria bacterium]